MHGSAPARVIAAPANLGTLTNFYDTACRALADARRVDEVKDILDKAFVVREYARRGKNTKLVEDATAILLRAQRCCGEMLREMERTGERARRGGSGSNQHAQKSRPPTFALRLTDLNISKQQSSDWQALAAVPAEEFEAKGAGESKRAGE